MSDVVWFVVAATLLIGIFACAVYSAWQLFAPMKFRRVFVIYFESQSLRARASRWYWRTVLLLSATNCVGLTVVIASKMSGHPALYAIGVGVMAIGDILALVGVVIVARYEHQARNARQRELEAAAVR